MQFSQGGLVIQKGEKGMKRLIGRGVVILIASLAILLFIVVCMLALPILWIPPVAAGLCLVLWVQTGQGIFGLIFMILLGITGYIGILAIQAWREEER